MILHFCDVCGHLVDGPVKKRKKKDTTIDGQAIEYTTYCCIDCFNKKKKVPL